MRDFLRGQTSRAMRSNPAPSESLPAWTRWIATASLIVEALGRLQAEARTRRWRLDPIPDEWWLSDRPVLAEATASEAQVVLRCREGTLRTPIYLADVIASIAIARSLPARDVRTLLGELGVTEEALVQGDLEARTQQAMGRAEAALDEALGRMPPSRSAR